MKHLKVGRAIVFLDDDDFEEVLKFKWTLNGGYAYLSNAKGISLAMTDIIAAKNKLEGAECHHKDGNPLNNQKANLLFCNKQQHRAQEPTKNITGFRGVYAKRSKWGAQIGFKGQNIRLGVFTTVEEAALAYNRKAKELYGDSAFQNKL